ncbi:MAG: ParA family protein [Hydrogenovibrio crunogenus]|nr:ParA family protein [Hydrogenovibrio crunogenus]
MPKIISVISTKGGVGKTTVTANLAGFTADQNIKTLLIDADVQPSLSNYYKIDTVANGALQELMTNPEVMPEDVVSTINPYLDIIVSDDPNAELQKWVRDTPDGRFRLRTILKERFSEYDVILIDTQGAVGPLQEATVIASDLMLSPVIPDKLSASEFLYNTLAMINRLSESAKWMGIKIAPLFAVLNQTKNTSDCIEYSNQIRNIDFKEHCLIPITIIDVEIPDTVAFKDAASSGTPLHKFERNTRRKSASALEIMNGLAQGLGINVGGK